MSLILTSPAFRNHQPIAETFAQEGQNTSPSLAWTGASEGTKSFVLVVEDHDAPVGTVTHWVVYDGPKPPKGHGPHRYHFRLTRSTRALLASPTVPARMM
jgi:phosphatidylethanolamine-binding protein (PEBP) family uncharacterized protein